MADRFITPAGMKRLRSEYGELFGTERPKIVEIVSWAASLGDRSEMPIICMAKSACGRSTGASAISPRS